MSEPIITVENLGKCYQLGGSTGGGRTVGEYRTLRDSLSEGARQLFGRRHGGKSAGAAGESFWALRDVSFNVYPGEVVGIIGRNGAGKSTLLKILSRITEPTEGRVRLRGRVASLLEVGTGFHPELTGRENIYLNGSILGMARAEIRAKFDEIVAFAEVERFLDTPVKRYSSGMYVRLAFAVAAHLEPEILIVDEVLAVGDAEFQKKCLGKMDQVAKSEGRTVLFVSHSTQAILSLCSTVALFESGKLTKFDKPKLVMARYLDIKPQTIYRRKEDVVDAGGDKITAAWLELSQNVSPRPISTITNGAQICLVVQVTLDAKSDAYVIASFWDDIKRPLWEVVGGNYLLPSGKHSELRIVVTVPKLATPSFSIDIALGSNHAFKDHVRDAIICMVEDKGEYTGGGQRFPLAVEPTFKVDLLTGD